MYGKIHDTIYEGTLREHWEALITFEQMIILCNQDGILDMTPESLSGRTGIPLQIIKKGIKILEKNDPNSRTETEGGKRILLVNPDRRWGWQIVNHKFYRGIKDAEDRREYKRKWMKNKREKDKENQQCGQKCPQKSTSASASASVYTDLLNIFNGVAPEIWEEFEQHRKEIKKPLTELSRKKNMKVLNCLPGEIQKQTVDNTIANRWTGLFPPKGWTGSKTKMQKAADTLK